MEVISPVSPTEFDFNSSAYASAPSTPKLLTGDYYSAPTSPERISELYYEFDELLISGEGETHRRNSLATVPFAWEEKPGVPKSTPGKLFDRDFTFDVRGEFYPEDLNHGGRVKLVEADPPVSATVQDRSRERGRERNINTNTSGISSSRSRRTRSLPPLRDLESPPPVAVNAAAPMSSTITTLSASGSGKGSKKWSFMDLFLFRSASDGRALDRDPLKKYSAIFWKHDEDFRNSSLRGDRSGSGSGSKRRGRVSAHELHYTVNRAVSNDMKKKTFLPYKQGILGRLAFNPTVHALSNGFGFSHNHN